MAQTFKQGVLIYDAKAQRMDIRLDLDNYCGGLCCGQCIEVLFDGRWISTRIEMADDWYLVDVPTRNLVGLRVRIPVKWTENGIYGILTDRKRHLPLEFEEAIWQQ